MTKAFLKMKAFIALSASVSVAADASDLPVGVFNRTALPIGVIAVDAPGLSLGEYNRTMDNDDLNRIKSIAWWLHDTVFDSNGAESSTTDDDLRTADNIKSIGRFFANKARANKEADGDDSRQLQDKEDGSRRIKSITRHLGSSPGSSAPAADDGGSKGVKSITRLM